MTYPTDTDVDGRRRHAGAQAALRERQTKPEERTEHMPVEVICSRCNHRYLVSTHQVVTGSWRRCPRCAGDQQNRTDDETR